MTQRLSEDERHAIAHAEWAVSHATPNNPEVCFDYELVQTLLGLIKSGRAAEQRADLKARIDTRLNNYLCEMREGYDDSITGFNEAWDIVRKTFADAANTEQTAEPKE
jgi:hypothetical protein